MANKKKLRIYHPRSTFNFLVEDTGINYTMTIHYLRNNLPFMGNYCVYIFEDKIKDPVKKFEYVSGIYDPKTTMIHGFNEGIHIAERILRFYLGEIKLEIK